MYGRGWSGWVSLPSTLGATRKEATFHVCRTSPKLSFHHKTVPASVRSGVGRSPYVFITVVLESLTCQAQSDTPCGFSQSDSYRPAASPGEMTARPHVKIKKCQHIAVTVFFLLHSLHFPITIAHVFHSHAHHVHDNPMHECETSPHSILRAVIRHL